MLLMAYPGRASRSMHEGHALFQLKNCWQAVLSSCRGGFERHTYTDSCRQGMFFLYQNAQKPDAERSLLQWNFTSWLLTFKSLWFLLRTDSRAMQTVVWFQCNSQCSCQRGLVAATRLNQYLQQLHGTLPSSFSEFSCLLNLAEIILQHLPTVFLQ